MPWLSLRAYSSQYRSAGVVFFLGKFERQLRGPGLDADLRAGPADGGRTSLRTVTIAIPSQKIITKDKRLDRYRRPVAYYHVTIRKRP